MAAIEVQNLGKQYRIGRLQERHDTLRDALADMARTPARWLRIGRGEDRPPETIWALKDVSFDVQRGEVVGIIGRNGAGKSTLLKVLSRITEPTEGRARIRGRVGSLLEVGTGFHQELTGRENVYLNGAILGMRRAEIDHKFDEIVTFAGVEKFIDTPVKRYSSGMYLRLAFAVAAHLELEILLVDEVLAVGDAEFQKKCLGKMGDIAGEGRTVLLVSHQMAAIKRLCERVIFLDGGRVHSIGETSDVVAQYLLQGQTDSGVIDVEVGDPGVAVIHRVGTINAQNEFSSYLSADQDFRLYIECSVAQPLYKSQIAFAVLAADGTIVFVSTHSDQLPLDQTTLEPGHYRLAVRVPGQFLNVGGYSLNVRIWGALKGHERAAHASAFGVFVFQIEETGSMAARLRDRRGGLVTPLLEWEAVPADIGGVRVDRA